jgi:hypothetical protein
MSKKIVISLCDDSGNILIPWAEAGYECYAVDILHPVMNGRKVGNINYVYGDARSWCPPDGEIIFACGFPPCTHIAVSGARHFVKKGINMLTESLELFNAVYAHLRWSGAPFFVENPVSVLSTHFGKPDYSFDPCDYAGYSEDTKTTENYTKKTCLWTGNGFIMPAKKAVEPTQGSLIIKQSPSETRQAERSITPKGFSIAIFEANKPKEKI